MRNLPQGYDNPEHAPAKFCLICGAALSFDAEGSCRWACTRCHWKHEDAPQPAANVMIPVGHEDVEEREKNGTLRIQRREDALDPEQSRLVTIQRKAPPFKGKWAMPAGFVNSFEDPGEAAVREAREEVSLAVRLLRFVGACHPLRHTDARFAMNNIVLSWLASVEKDGDLVPADDASDAALWDESRIPELCFSSHKFIGQGWFAGKYPWSSGIDHIDFDSDAANADTVDLAQYCIKCGAPLGWSENIGRSRCQDTENCGWIFWNSPTPYSRAVLTNDNTILLRRQDGMWNLPNGPVPAYCSPSEGMRAAFRGGREIALRSNLTAIKISTTNRIDIVFGGQFNPTEPNDAADCLFPIRSLPDDLAPNDRRIIEHFIEGTYKETGSQR